jgi:branched-chain amino acid transport system permease protein
MSVLLQLIISGLLIGGVYGLIAMGFVVVYRSGRVFNMAYGQFAVVGAFMFWTFAGSRGAPRLSVPVAIVLTLLFAIAFGLLIERLVFRHMIGKPVFTSFIMTLGLLAILNSVAMIVWGPQTVTLPDTMPTGPLHLGSVLISREYLSTFIAALVIMGAFLIFFQRTRIGLAIRASYDNQVAARCLGVSARFNSQIAWVLCSVLATMGGILIATVQGASVHLSDLVMVVLVVVLIGGLDSLAGCVVGGLVLAVGENLARYYVGPYVSGIGAIFGVILILVVLLLRPNGIFGAKPVERV